MCTCTSYVCIYMYIMYTSVDCNTIMYYNRICMTFTSNLTLIKASSTGNAHSPGTHIPHSLYRTLYCMFLGYSAFQTFRQSTFS